MVNTLLGISSPFKFGINSYFGYDITKFKDNIRFLEVCNNRDGEVGGIVALYFDGATCTFKELPRADGENNGELQKWYNLLDKIRYEKVHNVFFLTQTKVKTCFSKLFNCNIRNIFH